MSKVDTSYNVQEWGLGVGAGGLATAGFFWFNAEIHRRRANEASGDVRYLSSNGKESSTFLRKVKYSGLGDTQLTQEMGNAQSGGQSALRKAKNNRIAACVLAGIGAAGLIVAAVHWAVENWNKN